VRPLSASIKSATQQTLGLCSFQWTGTYTPGASRRRVIGDADKRKGLMVERTDRDPTCCANLGVEGWFRDSGRRAYHIMAWTPQDASRSKTSDVFDSGEGAMPCMLSLN
jgi:hypothetical protein